MELNTGNIWKSYSNEIYFFILKRVKSEEFTKEILQNSFLKIHSNLGNLKHESKARAWVFQIVRNEINNFYKRYDSPKEKLNFLPETLETTGVTDDFCCFDRFIKELPESYKIAVQLVYIEGKTQTEAAEKMEISLANIKARIRRAKKMLKNKFQSCCKYSLDKNGNLNGEANCVACNP